MRKQRTVEVEDAVWKAFRNYCINNERKVAAVIEQLLTEFLITSEAQDIPTKFERTR